MVGIPETITEFNGLVTRSQLKPETDCGIESSGGANGDSAASAGNSSGVARASRSSGVGDAGPDSPGIQFARIESAREAARRLTGLCPEDIRFGEWNHIALHDNIKIVLDGEGQSVGQGQFELAAVNEIVEARRVFEHRVQQRLFEVGAPNARGRAWSFGNRSQEILLKARGRSGG